MSPPPHQSRPPRKETARHWWWSLSRTRPRKGGGRGALRIPLSRIGRRWEEGGILGGNGGSVGLAIWRMAPTRLRQDIVAAVLSTLHSPRKRRKRGGKGPQQSSSVLYSATFHVVWGGGGKQEGLPLPTVEAITQIFKWPHWEEKRDVRPNVGRILGSPAWDATGVKEKA